MIGYPRQPVFSRFRPRCERLEERAVPTAGHLDPTFGYSGVLIDNVRFQAATEIALPDGKYLAAGTTESIYQTDFAVARFNADGSVDTTFGKGGFATLDFDNSSDNVDDVVALSDGKILVLGSTGKVANNVFTQKPLLVRFNADGSLDTTFGNGGTLTLKPAVAGSNPQRLLLQPDGKLMVMSVVFDSLQNKLTLVRLNPDGTLDTSYGNNGVAQPNVPISYGVVAQGLADGRILIAGAALYGDAVAMIRPDGTLDPTFGTAGVQDLTNIIYPHALAVQGDGKILVAGESSSSLLSTPNDFVVLRLNGNGSADTSFGTGGRVQTDMQQTLSSATAIAVLSDGKILVGGVSSHNYALVYYPVDFAS